MSTSTVLLIIGLLLVIDSLFVFIFPRFSMRITKKILKLKNLKKIATAELAIGILILIIALFLR